jgi:hypothetical protein
MRGQVDPGRRLKAGWDENGARIATRFQQEQSSAADFAPGGLAARAAADLVE